MHKHDQYSVSPVNIHGLGRWCCKRNKTPLTPRMLTQTANSTTIKTLTLHKNHMHLMPAQGYKNST